MQEVGVVISVTTGIVITLSLVVLMARRWLVPSGDVQVTVNERTTIVAPRGEKLLWALAANDVLLPSACGGRGSCGQCRLTVISGGGAIVPTESAHIGRRDAVRGERLACMVSLRDDLAIRVPDAILGAKRYQCTVRSNRNVATYLKELQLSLPNNANLDFAAGNYIVVEAPPGESRFSDFQIDAPFMNAWQSNALAGMAVTRDVSETRAYSMANPPHEAGVSLVVRIALPAPGSPPSAPPGKVSSYIFALKTGDQVMISGPFGEFHACDSPAEMLLIGGGAGMAPLRSIILDQLLHKHTSRRMGFWYGARDAADVCYQEEFDALTRKFDNFSWHVALSEPGADSAWTGARGFIHSVVLESYLEHHPSPDQIEYYVCGPPLMSSAVLTTLEDLGVPRDMIYFDDFGA